MTKSILLSLALMLACAISNAQKNVYLTISHKLGASNFAFNQVAQNNLPQDFKITRVDYYISGIKIIHDGGMVLNVPSHYILVKGNTNLLDLLGNFNVTNVEGIRFSIGVESPTNTSDPSLFLAPHPLAPQSPSMHWGWSAGFRFIALEGTAGAGFGTTFQMHGLWNANYFEQTQMATGVVSGNDIYINLDADYTQALKGIDVNAGPIDHGVDATDLTVLQNFRDFVFKPGIGFPASVNTMYKDNDVTFYPNPTNGMLYYSSASGILPANILVKDVTGRVLSRMENSSHQAIDLSKNSSGLYFISLLDKDNRIMAEEKIVVE